MSPARGEPDTSTYSGRLSKRIRKLREDAGLTGEQLVERINKHGFSIKLSAYTHWENGRTRPNIDAFPAIAKALKVKIHELLPKK